MTSAEYDYLLRQLTISRHNFAVYGAHIGTVLKTMQDGLPDVVYQSLLKSKHITPEQAEIYIKLNESKQEDKVIYLETDFNQFEEHFIPFDIDSLFTQANEEGEDT